MPKDQKKKQGLTICRRETKGFQRELGEQIIAEGSPRLRNMERNSDVGGEESQP